MIPKLSKKKLFSLLFGSMLLLSSCQKDEGEKMFEKALQMVNETKYHEATQNFVALTKAFPDHPLADDSLFWIANLYEHYLNDPKQGIRYYRSLNRTFEDSEYQYQAMLGLARIYSTLEDDEKRKAVLIHRKLKKMELPEKEVSKNQYQLAKLYLDLKQYEKARVELKHLILNHTDSEYTPKAYHLIGFSYYMEGKRKLAEITFQETDQKFEYSRKSLTSAISLADIYEGDNRLQDAIKVYQTILDRLEEREVFYQLAKDRIDKLRLRLQKTDKG